MATYKIDNVVLRIQNNKLVASVDYSISRSLQSCRR